MANQISKEAILSFLNERLDSRKNRIGNFKSIEAELTNNAKIELLEDLIGNIERGMFNESNYITYPNGAMIDKKITSNY